ncbi:MAG: hypothetical protein CMJ46_02005 [Planctomyces sp.]|nr:hypothetical protein [Planctomyces sp.]
MKRVLYTLLCLSLMSLCGQAQEPQPSPVLEEHALLQKFTGDWTSVGKTIGTPDQPSTECKGKMSSHMLGDFWVVNKLEGTSVGMEFHGLQTIGYDAEKQKYVGTWVDTMMNHMWKYEGTYDASTNKLSLVAEGPSFFVPGEKSQYRDSYEFKSDNKIIATSEVMGDDGKWITFMTGEMTRDKK